ncbi:Asp-tRNA(Asn)/Glu-tRNA(Gln) amidotransferase A subunit family amidase [Caldalkalibacillus uzonensis]|uniref:Asp-tRNA(Asn)/Glu-tRNA(Gln) amidotransferase A subunit family amidase n=1 Tax=Caldalkalibacillus uzonensis TaxID=353224 RepID=A0ABU0CW42_9BACI|nr:amidase family protein [Caldalkalibacillus uzonensis]MDQ0340069.1 Asp-tRNA(Asn)/Glu-tRNA(Gln) amidotransferase A subunit family amidase [Caldalkalibacillus uzonensis]
MAKELSPVDVIQTFLKRIEQINPKVNAFCTLNPEGALMQAKQAEQAIIKGERLNPLHGIPVAIKDLTPTRGLRTTYGSLVYAEHVPDVDAICVQRIKQAGAIILGKTNTPEFGYKGTTDNKLFGPTRNPWALDKTAGGSSGGAAAAVAAGLVPLAEGSDGGGSIRIPASLCGVFGFKPTYGRIPSGTGFHTENSFGYQHPFLHHGPLTRTVEDAALFYSVMAGPHPSDPFCLPEDPIDVVQSLQDGVQGKRVAYSRNLGWYEIDKEVEKAVEQGMQHLSELGCYVEEVNLDFGLSKRTVDQAFNLLWLAHFASQHRGLLPRFKDQLSEDMVYIIEKGQQVSLMDYKHVERVRTKVWQTLQQLFQTYDLLVCPTLAVAAFSYQIKGPSTINDKEIHPASDWMLTPVFNLTGHPAASVPVGFTRDERPIGMQVIGRRMEDSLVLRLAYAYEQAFPWHTRKPGI